MNRDERYVPKSFSRYLLTKDVDDVRSKKQDCQIAKVIAKGKGLKRPHSRWGKTNCLLVDRVLCCRRSLIMDNKPFGVIPQLLNHVL